MARRCFAKRSLPYLTRTRPSSKFTASLVQGTLARCCGTLGHFVKWSKRSWIFRCLFPQAYFSWLLEPWKRWDCRTREWSAEMLVKQVHDLQKPVRILPRCALNRGAPKVLICSIGSWMKNGRQPVNQIWQLETTHHMTGSTVSKLRHEQQENLYHVISKSSV